MINKFEIVKMDNLSKCPFCNNDKFYNANISTDRLNSSCDSFKLVKCSRCNLIFQNPRVSPSSISIFYPSDYFKSRKVIYVKNRIKSDIVNDNIKKKGKLIEIGSANGDFLHHMKDEGWYVEGVEVSRDGVEYSKENYRICNVHHGGLTTRKDNGVLFDVVVFWGSLPHIFNPTETISQASKLLKNKGKMIITCANIDSIPAKIMGDKWGHLDLPRHYFMYSPDTLTALLRNNNLLIDSIVFHDDLWNSNIDFFKLKPMLYIDSFFATQNTVFKIYKKITGITNKVLTYPILVFSRMLEKGGIMTVIATKIE